MADTTATSLFYNPTSDVYFQGGQTYSNPYTVGNGGVFYIDQDHWKTEKIKSIYIGRVGEDQIVFSGNTTTNSGGAFAINSKNVGLASIAVTIDLDNVVFENNRTTGNYGAAFWSDSQTADIRFSNSIFRNNVQINPAYATVVLENGIIKLDHCTFSGNTTHANSETSTGALYLEDKATAILDGCTFTGNTNTSSYQGYGAVSMNGQNGACNLVLKGSNFFDTKINSYRSNIVFDISDKTSATASQAILNDALMFVEGSSTLSTLKFNVSSNQESGRYVLAGNNATISSQLVKEHESSQDKYYRKYTIQVDGTDTDKTVTVNNTTDWVKVGNHKYQLTVDNSQLVLDVKGNYVFLNTHWDDTEIAPGTGGVSAWYKNEGYLASQENTGSVYHLDNEIERAITTAATEETRLVVVQETEEVNTSMVLKGVETDFVSGEFTRLIVGGSANEAVTANAPSWLMISGGTFGSNVIGSDYVSGQAVTETKGNRMEISGGTFSAAVAGGMYAYTGVSGTKADLSVGEGKTAVNMVISGGEFDGRIYGGNYARRDEEAKATNSIINGDISITIDCSDNKIKINKGITVGSRGTGEGMILGNTKLTITGSGANLDFEVDNKIPTIWGGCNLDSRKYKDGKLVETTSGVSGDRVLVFDNFQDTDFDATVGLFTELQAVNNSTVNFTNSKLDLSDVKSWVIEKGSSLTGLQGNDFTGDSLDFHGVAGDTLMSGTADSFANLELANRDGVYLNGHLASWDDTNACWASADAGLKLVVENNSLKLDSISIA